jgi:hypothetical protein
MPTSSSAGLVGAGRTIGRPFATLLPLLLLAVLLIGPGRRGPPSALVAMAGFTPLMGTAMAGERVTRAPQTVAAQRVAARREWNSFMGLRGDGEALALPVRSLSGPWKQWVLIRVNRAVEIAQARL